MPGRLHQGLIAILKVAELAAEAWTGSVELGAETWGNRTGGIDGQD